MIAVDEMAHVKEEIFWKVIMPMLKVKSTSLFGLSSPEGSQSFFTKLIRALDPQGQKIFKTVDCVLICEACLALEDMDERIKCTHVREMMPWLSTKHGEKLKYIAKMDPATVMKELMGAIADDFKPCFPKDAIAKLFASPRIATRIAPPYVFITVDPSGGGISQLAITSGYYDDTASDYVVSFFHFKFKYGPAVYSRRMPASKFVKISYTLCLSYGNRTVLST